MSDSIATYIETCGQYEKKLMGFKLKKDFNLRDDYSGIERDEESMKNESYSLKCLRGCVNDVYILKAQTNTEISMIMANIQTYKSVIALDLSGARLTSIHEMFAHLTELQVLNLQDNLFVEVPSVIQKLKLKHINFNNNLLRSLMISEEWSQSVEKLDIGRNHIRQLSLSLFTMEYVTFLDLRSNDFTVIPRAMLNIQKSLQILGLDWVQYSFDGIIKDRKDLLMEQSLSDFWWVLKDSVTDLECHDFLLQQINDFQLPSPICAQQPNSSFVTRATINRTFDLNLDLSMQSQSFKTQGIDNDSNNGQNILHYCVKNEHLGVLRTLLAKDLLPCIQVDEDGHTPLTLAIYEEKYYCAKIFINALTLKSSAYNINQANGINQSLLNLAIQKMQFYLIKDLLNANVKPYPDHKGNGPFHYLIGLFKRSVQEATKIGYLLIESGLDPNEPNNHLTTPVHLAIKKSSFSAVRFCLQCNERYGVQIFNFKSLDAKKNSIMHLAAISENIKIIQQLYPMSPHLLFAQNALKERPFDIIQKNYTLSKIFAVLEQTFISRLIHTRNVEGSVKQSISNQSKSAWNLNDSDDECGKLGLQLQKLQPKFQITKCNVLKMKDRPKIKNLEDKINSERAKPIIIHKSIQEDRNDIKQIELQNKYQLHTKSLNKNIHKLIKEIQHISAEAQTKSQQQAIMKRILYYQMLEVRSIQADPLLNIFLDSACRLQQFDLNSITVVQQSDLLDEYEIFNN